MSDFQKKYAPGRLAQDLRKQQAQPAQPAEAEAEARQESASHLGVERNRKTRLKLRFKDGRVRAVNYSDVVLMDYDPDEGITLDLPPHFRVRLKGVALDALLDALAAECVSSVREVDGFAASASQDGKPVVVSISFEKWAE
jgi:hypothetical protein